MFMTEGVIATKTGWSLVPGDAPPRVVRDSDRVFQPSGRLRFRDASEPRRGERASSLAARAATTVYRRLFFLTYSLVGRRVPGYRPGVDVEFGALGPGQAELYRRFRPSTSSAELSRRFARGDRCYVALRRGEIVDACWAASGRVEVPYLHRSLELGPGDLYFFDSYTRPEYRGRGLYMARNAFTAAECGREGFTRLVALVAAEKYAVWQILTRSGLMTSGRYDFVRLGPLRWYRILAVDGEALPRLV
jgi:hypothetical protein